jgi:hypothetical protein
MLTKPQLLALLSISTALLFGACVGDESTAVTLSVSRVGNGAGVVSSNPDGIACGATCEADFETGSVVVLTAAASPGSTFRKWGGACSGDGPECTVTLNQATAATAEFTLDDVAPAPDYSVAIASALATTSLGTEVAFTINLAASQFSGPVSLSLSGAPANWTTSVEPATVNVADGALSTATIRIRIPTNGDAAPSGKVLTLNASAAPGAKSATAKVIVNNELFIDIAPGTGSGAHWGALAGTTLRVKAGTTLKFRNLDSTGHRIHANGEVIDHEDTTMGPGQTHPAVARAGTDEIYCHDHLEASGKFNLIAD